MTRVRFVLVSIALLALVSGCSALNGLFKGDGGGGGGGGASASPKDEAKQKETLAKLDAFEALQPDAAALGRGDTEAFEAMLQQCNEIRQGIQALFPDGPDADKLFERTLAKKRAYILEASRVAARAGEANTAFWVLIPYVDNTYKYEVLEDNEVMKEVRTTAQSRAAFRQDQLAKFKSYAADGIGGNCVFSTAPFEAEGTRNPALAYYFEGRRLQIHVRCYSEDDLSNFSGPDGKFFIKLAINEYVWFGKPAGTPEKVAKGDKVLEATFTIPEGDISKDDFALLDATAGFEWISGWTWENGNQVPTFGSRKLAGSSFLWEREAKPL